MIRRPVLLALLLLLALLAPQPTLPERAALGAASGQASADASPSRPSGFWRVFILQSYNPEYIWTQNINLGVFESLRDVEVVYDYFYMDAKRRPDKPSLVKAASAALERIAAFDPDVVIAVDDAAQAYVVAPSLLGKARPQVIFCGLNAPPSLYGFPGPNVSGVRERWHIREGVALLKRLVPSARSVVFLTDASESTDYIIQGMREDIRQNGPYALELKSIDSIGSYQAWQQRILSFQGKADAIALGIYHSLRDERTGKVVPPEEAAAWMNSVNVKPTLGFADYALDHGIMCGVLEAGHEQGYLAGSMAREVMSRGGAAGDLPMRINDRGVIMLNLKSAERLNVDIPYEIIEAAGEVVR